MGELRAEPAIPALLESFQDQDSLVREAAARALGELRAGAAIPALLESLQDQDWSVRGEALDALWQIAEAHPPGVAQRFEATG